jgi:hypothetical protein
MASAVGSCPKYSGEPTCSEGLVTFTDTRNGKASPVQPALFHHSEIVSQSKTWGVVRNIAMSGCKYMRTLKRILREFSPVAFICTLPLYATPEL